MNRRVVLVCGGRDYNDREFLFRMLDQAYLHKPISLIIHGAARGADHLAGEWARERGIDVKSYPAHWDLYGRSAGPIRNRYMLDDGKPDFVIAFPGGNDTRDMINEVIRRKIPSLILKEE